MSVFTNNSSSSPEEIKGYVGALLGLVGGREPIVVLRETPDRLTALVRGLSETQAARPEADGKWSVRHVVQHLADTEIVFGWRFRMILAHDRPSITGYDQDLWADRLGYGSIPLAESLEDFVALRRASLRLLGRIPPESHARVGVHAERGEESVAHLFRLYAGHDQLHLNQVERIVKGITAG